MILKEDEITELLQRNADWLVFLNDEKENWRQMGQRPTPPVA
jgi:hypothetical protein